MRNLLVLALLSFITVACQGNPVSPTTPPPSAPETPAPAPLPAAPKALLAVGRGDLNPPVGIENFTPMLFDASRSEGDGLTYLLEFGDGASSNEPVATHRPRVPRSGYGSTWSFTARLTVTDRHGRSDSTTHQYFAAPIATVGGAFWHNVLSPTSRRPVGRTLHLRQDGALLSGWYFGPESRYLRVTGMISDERTVRLRTENGAIEFVGVHGWRPHDPAKPDSNRRDLVLRLAIRGGMANGATLDFDYADPY